MNASTHCYDVDVTWTGNNGQGTKSYRSYGRNHEIAVAGTPPIPGTADTAFRGEPGRWNPEQLQVAALSQCHMLWYLHLAAVAGVVVTAYEDQAQGIVTMDSNGGGQFESVTLRPRVTITADTDADKALQLHSDVPSLCFIARSVNFPVHHEPAVAVLGG